VIEWAGLPYLSLRVAGWFYENLPLLHGADIRGDGVIRNSFDGDVQVPWLASEDAGKIAASSVSTTRAIFSKKSSVSRSRQ